MNKLKALSLVFFISGGSLTFVAEQSVKMTTHNMGLTIGTGLALGLGTWLIWRWIWRAAD